MSAALKFNSRNIAKPYPARRDVRVNTENKLQRAVADLLVNARHPLALMWHVPNGGKRNIVTAANLKRDGVLAGVPDFCGFNANASAVFLELKRPGGVASENQKWFRDQCERSGAAWACVDNIDDATEFLARHGIVRVKFPATVTKEKAADVSGPGHAMAGANSH